MASFELKSQPNTGLFWSCTFNCLSRPRSYSHLLYRPRTIKPGLLIVIVVICNRGVVSYIKLGRQIYRQASRIGTCRNYPLVPSILVWVDNCPLCPSATYIPAVHCNYGQGHCHREQLVIHMGRPPHCTWKFQLLSKNQSLTTTYFSKIGNLIYR